jgi:hypothetical protein
MNLHGNKAVLSGATKELLLRWDETKHAWHDGKSREFEERYLRELLTRVDQATTLIDKLDEVLQKVHKDCD